MAKRKAKKTVTITVEYLHLLWRQLDYWRARAAAGK
jgi:hypothetical protein